MHPVVSSHRPWNGSRDLQAFVKPKPQGADASPVTRFRALALVLSLALVLAACSGDGAGTESNEGSDVESTTTTAPPTTTTSAETSTTVAAEPSTPVVDENTFVYTDGESTIAFTRPAGFIEIDLTANDVQEVFGALEEEEGVELNESLEAVVDAALSNETAEFIFWGFDFENSSIDFVSNVNALRLPAGPFDRPEVYAEVLPTQYAELGIEVVSIEEIETGLGPAVKVVSMPPEEWIEYVTVQLLAPTDEWVYSITFSYETLDDVHEAVVNETFESLALLGTASP